VPVLRAEKISYGLGDTASNLVFQSVLLYLAFFYTDIAGIAPADVATLFLVVRIFDAITDPVVGLYADRVNTRWGTYRPFILFGSVPFAISCALVFLIPDTSYGYKLLYAYLTYSLLTLMYTLVNIPYSALAASLSSDSNEQVSIQSYRFAGAMLGGFVVTAVMGPLVSFFTDMGDQQAYFYAVSVMALLSLVLLLQCFRGTRERRLPPAEHKKFTEVLPLIWQNKLWRILMLTSFVLLVGYVFKTTLAIYYFKHIYKLDDHITTIIALGMLFQLIGSSSSGFFSSYFPGLKGLSLIMLMAAMSGGVGYFFNANALGAVIIYLLWCFFFQMHAPIFWGLMARCADLTQEQSGEHHSGAIFSTVQFMMKLGLAVGGAAATSLLALGGYQVDIELTDQATEYLGFGFTVIPSILFLLAAGVFFNFKKYK